jgi:hypothetical protein
MRIQRISYATNMVQRYALTVMSYSTDEAGWLRPITTLGMINVLLQDVSDLVCHPASIIDDQSVSLCSGRTQFQFYA